MQYSADGRDRYAVQWHHKNLDAWCQMIPQYNTIVRLRLIKALAASDRWSLEPPVRPGDLCIIAMRFSEEHREFNSLPDIRAEVTPLVNVEDIKKYFPVCWKSRNNVHTLEFHNTFVRALAQKYSMDELEIRHLTIKRLMTSLKNYDWIVSIPEKITTSEICIIHK